MKIGGGLLVVLSSLCVAIAHSRKIDDCIGWTPEECSSHHGCRTCYDGTRLECYPDGLIPTLQTYGAINCPSDCVVRPTELRWAVILECS